ncbi:isoprenylcysteine carboxylmethyltransferase family protein [Alcanivorax sp. 1008]|uniref:methyltransferase family protein n=1 Tax=Alcanivorax sp. 1008 TaxID=2816853 RepID=UPI001D74A4BD|nr:isoprenylcysteine carboxylmethyltransferase family protein [Alcanivorax sp. 1008]
MKFLELRIPPPLVGGLIGLAMWALTTHSLTGLSGSARLIVAVVLVLMGAGVSLAGVVSFRRARTTVNPLKPEKTSSLVCSGIYRVTRNPMYLGFLLVLIGWAVMLGSAFAVLGPVLFVVYISRFQILPEERVLQNLFGDEFTAYQARVRRWL